MSTEKPCKPYTYTPWALAEQARALQLFENTNLSYAAIAEMLFMDGYSTKLRSRHSVRARIRDLVGELPVRRRQWLDRPTESNLKPVESKQ